MKNKKRKAGALIIGVLAVLMVSLGLIHYNNEKNVEISDFAQQINLSDYNTLSNNSSSNKIIVSESNKKELKKLNGVKDIVKTNGLYFVTFDSVKKQKTAYEILEEEAGSK